MHDTGGPLEVALYPYLDRDGNLLFEVIRYLKPTGEKVFRQRRPDGRRPGGSSGKFWQSLERADEELRKIFQLQPRNQTIPQCGKIFIPQRLYGSQPDRPR